MTNITASLLITLIGMVLVFIALAILWGLMEGTVQTTAWYNKRHPEEEEGEEEEAEVEETLLAAVEALPGGTSVRQKAAAAAVAVALALEAESPESVVELPGNGYNAQPSAWKSVLRSAQLTQRSTHFTRKSRGSVR